MTCQHVFPAAVNRAPNGLAYRVCNHCQQRQWISEGFAKVLEARVVRL